MQAFGIFNLCHPVLFKKNKIEVLLWFLFLDFWFQLGLGNTNHSLRATQSIAGKKIKAEVSLQLPGLPAKCDDQEVDSPPMAMTRQVRVRQAP